METVCRHTGLACMNPHLNCGACRWGGSPGDAPVPVRRPVRPTGPRPYVKVVRHKAPGIEMGIKGEF